MRYYCHFCHKSVTSEVPDDTLIRAILICPECIEAKKILFPEEKKLGCKEYRPDHNGECLNCDEPAWEHE